jgi:hypothetical protein
VYKYNATLRQHALGNFKELTKAVTKDPAMLVYLNGNPMVKPQQMRTMRVSCRSCSPLVKGRILTIQKMMFVPLPACLPAIA